MSSKSWNPRDIYFTATRQPVENSVAAKTVEYAPIPIGVMFENPENSGIIYYEGSGQNF